MWKPINGYFWPYRINEMGDVERQIDDDEWVSIHPFITWNKHRGRLFVRRKSADGKWLNVVVKNLMIDAFFGGRKPGDMYAHRNGMISDCSVYNLVKTNLKKVGQTTGGGNRRAIEKVDKNGQVVALYSSVTEAAEKNFISRKAIWLRCKKRLKDPYMLDGCTYRYEEPNYNQIKKSRKK